VLQWARYLKQGAYFLVKRFQIMLIAPQPCRPVARRESLQSGEERPYSDIRQCIGERAERSLLGVPGASGQLCGDKRFAQGHRDVVQLRERVKRLLHHARGVSKRSVVAGGLSS